MGLVGVGGTSGTEAIVGISETVGTLGTGEVEFGDAEREGWLGVV